MQRPAVKRLLEMPYSCLVEEVSRKPEWANLLNMYAALSRLPGFRANALELLSITHQSHSTLCSEEVSGHRSYNIADRLTSTSDSRGCIAGPWCKASIADHAEGFKIVDHNSELAHPVLERGTGECNIVLRISSA